MLAASAVLTVGVMLCCAMTANPPKLKSMALPNINHMLCCVRAFFGLGFMGVDIGVILIPFSDRRYCLVFGVDRVRRCVVPARFVHRLD